MYTNAQVSLFNKWQDSEDLPKYTLTAKLRAFVEIKRSRTTEANANETRIYIPIDVISEIGKIYVDPIEYMNKSEVEKGSCMTFKKGDVIVVGSVGETLNVTLSGLRETYSNVVVLNTINDCRYGSTDMHHFMLVGN